MRSLCVSLLVFVAVMALVESAPRLYLYSSGQSRQFYVRRSNWESSTVKFCPPGWCVPHSFFYSAETDPCTQRCSSVEEGSGFDGSGSGSGSGSDDITDDNEHDDNDYEETNHRA